MKVLESLEEKIRNDPKIESVWESFHFFIEVPAEFKVDERTLFSFDVYKEIAQIHFNAKYGHMVKQRAGTNLCAYFVTMSALRHQLRKIVGSEKAGKEAYNIYPKYAGLKIEEYLERRDEDDKRFERDLSVMIGCVSPRSLSGLFKIFF